MGELGWGPSQRAGQTSTAKKASHCLEGYRVCSASMEPQAGPKFENTVAEHVTVGVGTGSPSIPLPGVGDEADVQSWDDLARFTGGLPVESIEPLKEVRELESVYPLLHALTRGSLVSFLVRAAVLESLVRAERACFTSQDLAEALFWLDERARTSTLNTLKQSGWLETDARVGTTLTDAGRWVYDVLSFLHKRVRENELLPTVEGLEYALRIGVDPLRHLMSMRSRLAALREDIEAARSSFSEVMLRRATDKLAAALNLSQSIRAVLDKVPVHLPSARKIAREVHDLLSRLHGTSSELHAEITEIGRQYIRLTAGLTVEQIVRSLMRCSLEELASVGRSALLPALPSVPLLTTESVALNAEIQFLREHPDRKPVVLREPELAPHEPNAASLPDEVVQFLEELTMIAQSRSSVPLGELVPHGDESESFLRASLLSLVGSGRGGSGVTGALGTLALDVHVEGDGWPTELEHGPLKALSKGFVAAKKLGDHDG